MSAFPPGPSPQRRVGWESRVRAWPGQYLSPEVRFTGQRRARARRRQAGFAAALPGAARGGHGPIPVRRKPSGAARAQVHDNYIVANSRRLVIVDQHARRALVYSVKAAVERDVGAADL